MKGVARSRLLWSPQRGPIRGSGGVFASEASKGSSERVSDGAERATNIPLSDRDRAGAFENTSHLQFSRFSHDPYR
jgi:hypothetical protein